MAREVFCRGGFYQTGVFCLLCLSQQLLGIAELEKLVQKLFEGLFKDEWEEMNCFPLS